MLSKSEKYQIDNIIENIENDQETGFLDTRLINYIIPILKKKRIDYHIFKLFEEASKFIIHTKNHNAILLKINSKMNLHHSDILGSLFALGLDQNTFGDIIIKNNQYYFAVKSNIVPLIMNDLHIIGKSKVEVNIVNIEEVSDYELQFEEITLNVSSLRFDVIFSKITNLKRDTVSKKVKDKEIMINSQILNNNSYLLKESDIISVRGYGKYIYDGIINKTKKDKNIVKLRKYI